MRLRVRSWAKSLIVLCDNIIDGPMKVRPAVQGLLTADTLRTFHSGNKVRLKYGTVLAVADLDCGNVWLVAQPIWRGTLREPMERGVHPTSRISGKSVPHVAGMRRYTWFNPNDLGDVSVERDVLYAKPIDLRPQNFFGLRAEGDIANRDGFAEFTAIGREAIDLFTNQVVVDAVGDFVPENQASPAMKTPSASRAVGLPPSVVGLETLSMQQSSGQNRPTTSTVLPRDFGDLDLL